MVSLVSLGYDHTCVKTASLGEVKCWGWNNGVGMLGRGTNTFNGVGCSPLDMGTNLVSVPVPSGCTVVLRG